MDESREALANLVFEKKRFTLEGITQDLIEATGGKTRIDPRQSIEEFLNELVDLNYLQIKQGNYVVRT